MEEQSSPHPETLEETTPAFISDTILLLQYVYATYGWFIFGGALLSLYVWSKVKPHFNKWMNKREEEEYAAQVHKNPDLFRARQAAIEATRQRMQEEHDRMAQVKAERAKQLEEQKREEWLERHTGSGGSGGHRLNGTSTREVQPGPSKKKSSNFRPEYNPLMGAGSSGGYRPQKRGCPGGGCGKK